MLLQEKKSSVSDSHIIIEKEVELADIQSISEVKDQNIASENSQKDRLSFLPFNPAIAIGVVLAGSLGLAVFGSVGMSLLDSAFGSFPCGSANSEYQNTK